MRVDDDRVLVLRSTASEEVTQGKNRVRMELARVKGLEAALVDAAAELAEVLALGGKAA